MPQVLDVLAEDAAAEETETRYKALLAHCRCERHAHNAEKGPPTVARKTGA